MYLAAIILLWFDVPSDWMKVKGAVRGSELFCWHVVSVPFCGETKLICINDLFFMLELLLISILLISISEYCKNFQELHPKSFSSLIYYIRVRLQSLIVPLKLFVSIWCRTVSIRITHLMPNLWTFSLISFMIFQIIRVCEKLDCICLPIVHHMMSQETADMNVFVYLKLLLSVGKIKSSSAISPLAEGAVTRRATPSAQQYFSGRWNLYWG